MLFTDSIENLIDPIVVLNELLPLLKNDGSLITNYFILRDIDNVEHISMDREAIKQIFLNHGIYPVNPAVWIKRDLGFMDRKEEAA